MLVLKVHAWGLCGGGGEGSYGMLLFLKKKKRGGNGFDFVVIHKLKKKLFRFLFLS